MKSFSKTAMPFFSIVIPLYNKEKFIGRTLESIFDQTFSDYEIIIVNDCSTDQSLSIARQFARDNVSIMSHEKNQGLSAARNTGIALAKADFIAFIDSDDLWKPQFLEKMHVMIQKFPHAGLFASAYEESYPGFAIEVKKNISNDADSMEIISDFFTANAHQPIFCYSSVVMKKIVFETIGLFDQKITLGEDVDFNIRANSKFALAYYNRVCASYTIFSENQITNSSIAHKVVTDFDKYEPLVGEFPSLKLYLDTNRYILAMHYKMAGDKVASAQMLAGIDAQNLTSKQRLLLKMPLPAIKLLQKIKRFLLQKGIRLTSFR